MFLKFQYLAYIWLCNFPMYVYLIGSIFLIKVGQVSFNFSRLVLIICLAKGETNHVEICK